MQKQKTVTSGHILSKTFGPFDDGEQEELLLQEEEFNGDGVDNEVVFQAPHLIFGTKSTSSKPTEVIQPTPSSLSSLSGEEEDEEDIAKIKEKSSTSTRKRTRKQANPKKNTKTTKASSSSKSSSTPPLLTEGENEQRENEENSVVSLAQDENTIHDPIASPTSSETSEPPKKRKKPLSSEKKRVDNAFASLQMLSGYLNISNPESFLKPSSAVSKDRSVTPFTIPAMEPGVMLTRLKEMKEQANTSYPGIPFIQCFHLPLCVWVQKTEMVFSNVVRAQNQGGKYANDCFYGKNTEGLDLLNGLEGSFTADKTKLMEGLGKEEWKLNPNTRISPQHARMGVTPIASFVGCNVSAKIIDLVMETSYKNKIPHTIFVKPICIYSNVV